MSIIVKGFCIEPPNLPGGGRKIIKIVFLQTAELIIVVCVQTGKNTVAKAEQNSRLVSRITDFGLCPRVHCSGLFKTGHMTSDRNQVFMLVNNYLLFYCFLLLQHVSV